MEQLTTNSFNLDLLKATAGLKIYERGQAHYQKGLVEIEEVGEAHAYCYVYANDTHQVEIRLSGNLPYYRCDCRYSVRSLSLVCEHAVASALAVKEYLRQHPPSQWKAQLSQVLADAGAPAGHGTPRSYMLFFSLAKEAFGYTAWKITPYQYPLGALPDDLRQMAREGEVERVVSFLEELPEAARQAKAPYNAMNPAGCVNSPPAGVILGNLLVERARTFGYYSNQVQINDLLLLAAGSSIPLFLSKNDNPLYRRLEVLPGDGQLVLEIARQADGLHLKAHITAGERALALIPGEVEVVCLSPTWVLAGQTLLHVVGRQSFVPAASWFSNPEMVIPAAEEDEFLERYYLALAQQFTLEGEVVNWEDVQGAPVARLYLSDAHNELQAQLRFGYDNQEVIYDSNLPEQSIIRKSGSWTLVRVQRSPTQEDDIYRSLSSQAFGLKRATAPAPTGYFSLRARTDPVDFLLHSVPLLTKAGFEIYGEEALKTARVNRNKPSISFNISSGIDWFDVQAAVNFGDIQVSLKSVRKALHKSERYIKLTDGTIGELPEEWINRYRHLFALAEESGDGLRLSNHHLTLLDQLLAESERVQTDPEFERRRQRLRDFSGIAVQDLPQGFMGELRPYQKAGYDWLHFLCDYGFGGCLADDMGLGKTIQVLAFFQSLKEQANGSAAARPASLVVVPRSLLVNWQREAARFTPELRVLEYFDKNRTPDTAAFNGYDVVITTYRVMLGEIEKLRHYRFLYVLLDESQAIKNPLSQTAKAARLLQSDHRLVLTGTPVENSTTELWSQFAFLNPGLLGNIEYFKEEFVSPIEKKGDEQTAQFLRKMVYPFILRRTKDQVAPELPPRSERILYSDMEPQQRKLYNRTRDYYRGLLMGLLDKDKESIHDIRFKILEGLLRLRQICNHPRLVEEHFRGESGKFELLLETLETLQSEGHKALVFSQFTQMLALVRKELNLRRVPYLYLDGATRDRQERVDNFQQDPSVPFFLISLKAGGVGLNLTAADYVIHIDPWWNPAVEMQATDRTHRIGQDKPVFVYKLITRDSVEEKILQLQERKKNLVDQLISTEQSFLKSLTQQDVEVLFGE